VSHKILYIEDNPQNIRLVRKMLGIGGYEMLEATNGEDGLQMVCDHMPDLILMDINLPDIDGMEVTARLKATPDLAHIPVVALTANTMHGDRERFTLGGCDGYLAKPITKKELLLVVAQFLGQYSV
jgi:two-component system cell cycle response regulator DivK